jgi:hypothetical protein
MAVTTSTGKVPDRGFGREHDGVRTIQDSISDVEYFCAGRHGVADHGFHHLRGRNHHAVSLSRGGNQILLNTDELGITHLNTQITARHHHAVGGVNDAVQELCVGHYFGPFNFRDDGGAQILIRQ